LKRCTFLGGASINVDTDEVLIEGCIFLQASVVAGSNESNTGEGVAGKTRSGRTVGSSRLVSLRWTDASNLAIYNLDVRPCRFLGAHNLDKLRLDPSVPFEGTPSNWRWTLRACVAEEHEWRHQRANSKQSKTRGWYPLSCQSPAIPLYLEPFRPATCSDIATVYRALRKGYEDSKNEPGAADLYYGEMEMRRHAPETPLSERIVLFLYWVSSGYGLRAIRAFAGLLVTITCVGFLLHTWGFVSHKPWAYSLVFASDSATSLLRAPSQQSLTTVGLVLEMLVRLLGPLFFGLALLSLRGRVRR
jgi:hypothetical protein